MKHLRTVLAGLMLALVGSAMVSQTAVAAEPEEIIGDASDVLDRFVKIPEGGIPNVLLRKAYGIAIIPGVIKVGFLGGVNYGQGVMSVRTRDGRWSKPTFVRLYGGSFGFQAGVSSTDLILVFKTKRSVRRLADGDFTLGGDASVAAGPVGRSTGASTNWRFNSEVYSYARARGLFAGVAVNGARLGIAKGSNETYYDEPDIEAQSLLTDTDDASLPPTGRDFIKRLNEYMPASDRHYDGKADDEPEAAEDEPADDKDEAAAEDEDWDNGQTQPYNQGEESRMTVEAQKIEDDEAAAETEDSEADQSDDTPEDEETEDDEAAESEADDQAASADKPEQAENEPAADEDAATETEQDDTVEEEADSAEPADAEAPQDSGAADEDRDDEDIWDYGASEDDQPESDESPHADDSEASGSDAEPSDETDDQEEEIWDYGAS